MNIGHWRADAAWHRIDLLSDVHLHAGAPGTFEAWKRHLLHTPADAVLILGDLFEVWVGDDARDDGFERACTDVLRSAGRKKALGFMAGNRDFLLGTAMRRETGLRELPDPTLAQAFGQCLLLSHGDALCLADAAYQRFRAEVRTTAWQTAFLALPLEERRHRARAMRDASVQHQVGMAPDECADTDAALASEWLAEARADHLVHGHTHRPATHPMPGGRTRWVLGDWNFDTLPHRARMLVWTVKGLQDIDLAAP